MTDRQDLPTGTVTFLFTDIEGSTRLVQELGEAVSTVFEDHARLIRQAVAANRGFEVSTEGDAFFCVFASAPDAVCAAVDAQRALHGHAWPDGCEVRVRMGLHTGSGTIGGDNYYGIDVHRAARVGASGHGGQTVITEPTRLAVASMPDGVTVRDLGLHRLKDLTAPEHLCDLLIAGLPDQFPPLRTIAPSGSQIPQPISSFVGRSDEVTAIVDLFDGSRLVTCTGPGGVGKSRLSLQVAERLAPRFDAVYFVPLAPISKARLVASTILKALGDSSTGEAPDERLLRFLSDKHWLLVLDNFEQVVDAAPLIADVLEQAPRVAFLVTSRTALRVGGEREYTVAPLDVVHPGADHDDALRAEAVRLFIDRARAVRPDLELDADTVEAIVMITDALDGLPLAIELAAARVRVLPPTAMRHKMGAMLDLLASGSRDLDARQRTLRGAISWSYDLLTDNQKRLLEDMSVFRGGATLDAIEASCGLDRSYWEWLEDLDALVGHSLVNRVETPTTSRFVLLEMIREFAAEKLAERGATDDIAEQHATWALLLSEQAAAGLLTVDQGTWIATLDAEIDNLRIAIDWLMARGDNARSVQLIFNLWRYWHMRGPLAEGAERAHKVLAMEGLRNSERLLALEAAGGLAWWAGEIDHAKRDYAEALALARECGTDEQIGNALYNAGISFAFDGAGGDGEILLNEGLEIAERTGNRLIRARCLWALASIDQIERRFDASLEKLAVAVGDFESAGDMFMVSWGKRELGSGELQLGRLEESERHSRAALDFFAASGDRSGMILLLRDFARLAATKGDMERAVQLIAAANAHESRLGLNLGQFELESVGIENPLVIDDETRAEELRAAARAWSIDEAVAYAREA